MIKVKLNFSALLTLQYLPYDPQQKQLGIKINKAYNHMRYGFFSFHSILKLEDDELGSLNNLLNKELNKSYIKIGNAGEVQDTLNQLNKHNDIKHNR